MIKTGVVEVDGHLKPTKSSIWHAEYTTSGSQAQLLAFPWRNYLELSREGVKGEYLAPSNSHRLGQVIRNGK